MDSYAFISYHNNMVRVKIKRIHLLKFSEQNMSERENYFSITDGQSRICHPKSVLLPLFRLRGLSKRKDIPEDFFTMEEQIQKNKDKKQKFAYWMRPSLVAEMTEMLESANATSKSDFVCQAVEFYIGYLWQQKNIDYLSPILAGVIRDEVESVEKNVCEMLFRLAGQSILPL